MKVTVTKTKLGTFDFSYDKEALAASDEELYELCDEAITVLKGQRMHHEARISGFVEDDDEE